MAELESYRIDPQGAKISADSTSARLTRQLFNLFGGNDPNSATLAPMPLGLSLKNPKNVTKMYEMISKNYAENASNLPGDKETKLALEYLKVKYPKLSNLVNGMWAKELGPVTQGQYDPLTKEISVGNQAMYPVQTGGHELVHALQHRKNPAFDTVYDAMSNQYGYRNNPYEVAARQGGATAHNTFQDFRSQIMQLLSPVKDVR